MDRICCLRTPTTEPAARAILGEVSSLPIRPASHFSACRFDSPIGVPRLQHVRLMRQPPSRCPARPPFWKGLGRIRSLCLLTCSLAVFPATLSIVVPAETPGATHPSHQPLPSVIGVPSLIRRPGPPGGLFPPAPLSPACRRRPHTPGPPAARPGRTERSSGSALSESPMTAPPEASTSGFSLASVARASENSSGSGLPTAAATGSSVAQRPVIEAAEAGLVDCDDAQARARAARVQRKGG